MPPEQLQRQLMIYREKLVGRSETLQPIIIRIGFNLHEIHEFVVLYDNIYYTFDNFIAALDCCFKVFHVLNLKYPKDGYNFWLFIQTYFFGIISNDDKETSNFLCLLEELM